MFDKYLVSTKWRYKEVGVLGQVLIIIINFAE